MKNQISKILLFIVTIIQIKGQGYLQLQNCIQYRCSNIISYNETQAMPGFYSDSDKFNQCQADNQNCYINKFKYVSDAQDQGRAQDCYNDCYQKDSYENDYFKFFLGCSWDCATEVYNIQNNFNKFKMNPGQITSICLIIVSTLMMAIRGTQIYYAKKEVKVIPKN
ncbi:hypothetical protein ABPG72_014109 [Tetrahymena utriculariae]